MIERTYPENAKNATGLRKREIESTSRIINHSSVAALTKHACECRPLSDPAGEPSLEQHTCILAELDAFALVQVANCGALVRKSLEI